MKTQETVEFVNFPSEFPHDTPALSVKVKYNVSEQRDINVELKSPQNKYITSVKQTVERGAGERTLTLNLDTPLPQGENYKFILSIRPVGGTWQSNITSDVNYASLVKRSDDGGDDSQSGLIVYVSTSGDDANDGSFQQPFRSIQKASNTMPEGGICYIREGVYRETIEINKARQTFQNYHDEYVLVTGLDSLSDWTAYKDNIYETEFNNFQTQFTQVFVNGNFQQMARFPDNVSGTMMDVSLEGGYAPAEAFNQIESETTRKVTFAQMPSLPDDFWKGGYYRGITGLTWQNPHGVIESSSGKDLIVNPKFKDWISNAPNIEGGGVGFIFHLNALDKAGEWYAQNGKLYLMPPAGTDINKLRIEAQKREYAFKTTQNGMKLKGLHIKAASIHISASDCIVDSCSIRYLFPYFTRSGYGASFNQQGGIYINGDNNVFKNCYVAGSWGNGFSLESGNGNRIENNIIEDIGWDSQFTSCILTHAENTTIKGNTFGSCGRFHIRFKNKTDILYNDLSDCMKMGQDAGSIEATSAGAYATPLDIKHSEIAYNLLHDCSTISSFKSTKNFVVALYIEDAYNYTVHHNVVWNYRTKYKQGAFVYLGPRRTTIKNVNYYNNTVWNCDKGIGIWNREKMGNILDTRFYNNLWDASMEMDDEISDFPELELKNNIGITKAADHFSEYENGNFSLKETSTAIDAGLEIPGYTDAYIGVAPDVGAYEYGKAIWTAGANITKPIFKEEKAIPTAIQHTHQSTIQLYPNPLHKETLHVKVPFSQAVNVWIHDINGKQVYHHVFFENSFVIPHSKLLKTGHYLLSCKSGNIFETQVLIVQ